MPKLGVRCFSLSIDGFGAGPSQSKDEPIGIGGRTLHEWIFDTRAGRRMIGKDGGETGMDDDFFAKDSAT